MLVQALVQLMRLLWWVTWKTWKGLDMDGEFELVGDFQKFQLLENRRAHRSRLVNIHLWRSLVVNIAELRTINYDVSCRQMSSNDLESLPASRRLRFCGTLESNGLAVRACTVFLGAA